MNIRSALSSKFSFPSSILYEEEKSKDEKLEVCIPHDNYESIFLDMKCRRYMPDVNVVILSI